MPWIDVVSWVLLGLGTFFCIVGGLGIHRMPDFYARTHAASITDTMGAMLMLLGLLFQCGGLHWVIASKLIFVAVFLLLTSPTAGHALVKAAAAHGVRVVSVAPSGPAPATSSAVSPAGEGGA